MIKIVLIVIASLIIGFGAYISFLSNRKKRSYKAKIDVMMSHMLGLDFSRMALCNIYAAPEELIFVQDEQEVRIPAQDLVRIECYSEHVLRRQAEEDHVSIASLDGLVRNAPRSNTKKDLYVLVINYRNRKNEIAVIGMVGDNIMGMIDLFVETANKIYALKESVVAVEGKPQEPEKGEKQENPPLENEQQEEPTT